MFPIFSGDKAQKLFITLKKKLLEQIVTFLMIKKMGGKVGNHYEIFIGRYRWCFMWLTATRLSLLVASLQHEI